MNRWGIAVWATLLQVCLGTVYAWSYFQNPIKAAFNTTDSRTMWLLSLAICCLGLSAAWAGARLSRFGPTRLAMAGGILYGSGYLLSAWAIHARSLTGFYLAFGLIGGCGLGLGYVTPVATVAKWFPDKKGTATGMVVMGFGLGALAMSKAIAPLLMTLTGGNLALVFLAIGAILLPLATLSGWFMRNPPAGFRPAGWNPPRAESERSLREPRLTAAAAILSRRFLRVWLFFFSNICVGMLFIGLQSPMLQDLLKAAGYYASESADAQTRALAAAGATLIGVSSLFNGIGRLFWGGISDKIGRVTVFRIILGTQFVVFLALMFVGNHWVFALLVCYVLLCYGGGFGTAPSTLMTLFGARLMPVVYGMVLTAWSAAGVIGTQLGATIKDAFPERSSVYTFAACAAVLAFGFVVSLFASDRHPEAVNDGTMK